MGRADHFLNTIHVPYIFMEWRKMYLQRHKANSPCPVEKMARLTENLRRRGYLPYETHTGFELNPRRSTTRWKIGDLYWKHKNAKPLQDPF